MAKIEISDPTHCQYTKYEAFIASICYHVASTIKIVGTNRKMAKPKGNSVTIKGFELDFEFRFNNIHLEYNFSYVDGYNKTLEQPLSYMNPTKEIINLKYVQKGSEGTCLFKSRVGYFEEGQQF